MQTGRWSRAAVQPPGLLRDHFWCWGHSLCPAGCRRQQHGLPKRLAMHHVRVFSPRFQLSPSLQQLDDKTLAPTLAGRKYSRESPRRHQHCRRPFPPDEPSMPINLKVSAANQPSVSASRTPSCGWLRHVKVAQTIYTTIYISPGLEIVRGAAGKNPDFNTRFPPTVIVFFRAL